MEFIGIISLLIATVALVKVFKLQALNTQQKHDLDYLEIQNKTLRDDLKAKQNILGQQIIKASKGHTVSEQEIENESLYADISASEALALIEKDSKTVIVDVRDSSEFKSGHLPNAIHIPLAQIESRWEEVSKDAPNVIVYCAAGMRSASACDFLSGQKKYYNLHNLQGGISSWNGPLVKESVGYDRFVPEMFVAEAMALHPRAREVFASFHLGGCSSCAISEEETVAQVMHNYGVDPDELLPTLNSLLDGEEVKVELPPESDLAKEKQNV